MADLVPQNIDQDGLAPTLSAAAGGGDSCAVPQPGLFLEVNNGAGAPITVTLNDPTSHTPEAAKQFDPDIAITVTNAQRRLIPIGDPRFVNPANGKVEWTYSSATTITVGVFRVID